MIRTLGVLLAGGRGARLGGPKARLRVAGETLLARAVRELSPCCDETVVVAPDGLELDTSLARVNDRIPQAGPLSALVAGLESREFERALALAVDLPRLTGEKLEKLLAAHAGEIATVPAPGGRAQPLAAVYSRAACAPLRQALESGGSALVPAVRVLGPRLLDDETLRAIGLSPSDFDDLDTPEDLAAFESRERRRA